jgi:hypothetical protein
VVIVIYQTIFILMVIGAVGALVFKLLKAALPLSSRGSCDRAALLGALLCGSGTYLGVSSFRVSHDHDLCHPTQSQRSRRCLTSRSAATRLPKTNFAIGYRVGHHATAGSAR